MTWNYYRNPFSDKKRAAVFTALAEFLPVEQVEQYLNYIDLADPTPNKEYSRWIVHQVKKEFLILPEDIQIIQGLLRDFDSKKRILPVEHRDIFSFKRRGDLAELLDKYSESTTKKGILRETIVALKAGKRLFGVKILISQPPYDVLEVTEPLTASSLTQNSQLCVRQPEYAARYLETSPLFLFAKNTDLYAMLFIGGTSNDPLAHSVQFRNRHDNPLTREQRRELLPFVNEIIDRAGGLTDLSLKKYKSFIDEVSVDKQRLLNRLFKKITELSIEGRQEGEEDLKLWLKTLAKQYRDQPILATLPGFEQIVAQLNFSDLDDLNAYSISLEMLDARLHTIVSNISDSQSKSKASQQLVEALGSAKVWIGQQLDDVETRISELENNEVDLYEDDQEPFEPLPEEPRLPLGDKVRLLKRPISVEGSDPEHWPDALYGGWVEDDELKRYFGSFDDANEDTDEDD